MIVALTRNQAQIIDWASNFHPAPIRFNDLEWPTAEHLYQAFKTEDPTWRKQIHQARTPGKAKRLGRMAPQRTGWIEEGQRLQAMRQVLRLKFEQHPELAGKLLGTKDATIIEYAPWGDDFWGIGRDGRGQNWLGRLLMEERARLHEIHFGGSHAHPEEPAS
jgi:ribA/ribD-fused uncharacterized protein